MYGDSILGMSIQGCGIGISLVDVNSSWYMSSFDSLLNCSIEGVDYVAPNIQVCKGPKEILYRLRLQLAPKCIYQVSRKYRDILRHASLNFRRKVAPW
jgi:hypothetical protein